MANKFYPSPISQQSDYRRFTAVRKAELLAQLAALKREYEMCTAPIVKQLAELEALNPPKLALLDGTGPGADIFILEDHRR